MTRANLRRRKPPERATAAWRDQFATTGMDRIDEMQIEILTRSPGEFLGYLSQPHVNDIVLSGQLTVRAHNFSLWTSSRPFSIDERSGSDAAAANACAEAVVACLNDVIDPEQTSRVALLSSAGRRLNPSVVREVFSVQQLLLVCGADDDFDRNLIERFQVDLISPDKNLLATSEVCDRCCSVAPFEGAFRFDCRTWDTTSTLPHVPTKIRDTAFRPVQL